MSSLKEYINNQNEPNNHKEKVLTWSRDLTHSPCRGQEVRCIPSNGGMDFFGRTDSVFGPRSLSVRTPKTESFR